jgi:hypothetical protein
MAKMMPLHSAEPPKLLPKSEKTIVVRSASDLANLRLALPLLEPGGPKSALLKALKILATNDPDCRTRAELIVQHLLVGLNHATPRPKDEIAKLLDIEAAAHLLEARIQQLHFSTRMTLLKELAATFGKPTLNLVSNPETQTAIQEISAKAATIRRQMAKDGRSAASAGRPSISEATADFMRQAITIFASTRGAAAVTSTIPSKNVGNVTCYAFADNLFRYATNRPLGHVRQFRQLVAIFRNRRKASRKS